jgi:hypothetical protein
MYKETLTNCKQQQRPNYIQKIDKTCNLGNKSDKCRSLDQDNQENRVNLLQWWH